MIYCNLKGGLANMLFQIAGATSIAIDNNHDVSFPNLDIQLNYLNSETIHNPHLDYAAEYKELSVFRSLKTSTCDVYDSHYTYPFHYTKLNISGSNILIDGFFQSEKYFVNNSAYIKHLFAPSNNIKSYIQSKYKDILTDSTSIHIRRGDYVANDSYHPTLPVDYFRQAINLTKNKTKKYIIFSDDIEWCKKTFEGNRFIFVEEEKDYIDFYIMSYCNNNIISNSSFSWLAAWLNLNDNKTIISPSAWFGNLITEDTKDLIPNSWIKI